MTFEEYLMDEYFRIENPLDDESVEGFESWIEDLGSDEIIEYAEKWKKGEGLMTGLETLKEELVKVQVAQSVCLDKEGIRVLNHKKWLYNDLTEQAKDLRSSIKWMEALYKGSPQQVV